jgi:hypothetical protein
MSVSAPGEACRYPSNTRPRPAGAAPLSWPYLRQSGGARCRGAAEARKEAEALHGNGGTAVQPTGACSSPQLVVPLAIGLALAAARHQLLLGE